MGSLGMNDQQPPENDASPDTPPDSQPKERFSRVSRIVLWVVSIGVLITAAIEGKTLYEWWSTYQSVNTAILDKAAEPGDQALFEADLKSLIRGNPSRNELSEFREELVWKSLFNEKTLILTLGKLDRRIASIETKNAE